MQVRGVAGLTVAILLLTFPASAQEGATLPRGAIYLTEPLEIKPGETLRVGPDTRVSGSANISVWGTLLVNGSDGVPPEISVPVVLHDGGRVEVREARLWGVNGTALEVNGGQAHVEGTLFEGNARAVLVRGDGALYVRNSTFRDHAQGALQVEGRARVTLEGASFAANGRGVNVYSAREFRTLGSDFVGNEQHLVISLGPWSERGSTIELRENVFRAPTATSARLPSVSLRLDPSLEPETGQRLVSSSSNRIEGAAVGIRIEGRSLLVVSEDDTFVDNQIGLSVHQATVRLHRPTLGNDRDVDGSAVTIDGATFLRGATVTPAPASDPWLPWAIAGGIALLVLGGLLASRRAKSAAARSPPPAPEPMPDPPATPEEGPDLATPLSPVERLILEDILAHPGTPQRDIAERLGYTRQALHYHVKKLEARKLVTKRVDGRQTRCDLPPEVAAFVAPATRTGSHEKA